MPHRVALFGKLKKVAVMARSLQVNAAFPGVGRLVRKRQRLQKALGKIGLIHSPRLFGCGRFPVVVTVAQRSNQFLGATAYAEFDSIIRAKFEQLERGRPRCQRAAVTVQSSQKASGEIVADSERRGFIGALPPRLRPYASLMRLDRPIGSWLLYWPCAWSVALAGVGGRWDLFLWLGLGAFATRSAGCVYNDIVDRDLDARVERTRLRPLASGRVTVPSACVLIALLLAIALVVLIQLDRTAQILSLVSVAPVAAYPFMKRITWWPQAWLGVVFSWGALVGWPAVRGSLDWPALLLWFGSIAWVVGYDTLYAIQDIEDDALVGVKSSARRLGDSAALGVGIFYTVAVLLWGAAIWLVRADWLALLALAPAALHLANQALRADPKDGEGALGLFRSNRTCGLLVFLAMLVVGLTAR